MRQYYVYIMTNRSGTLYTGMTNDLRRRVWQHKHGTVPGFTHAYHIDRLLYYEVTTDVLSAIEREKQIKRWRRAKKVALVEQQNRDWHNLAADWFANEPPPGT